MDYFAGIDIGSRTAKGVIIGGDTTAASLALPTGMNYTKAAEDLLAGLLEAAKTPRESISLVVATGQGAGNVSYAHRDASDIICCARGAIRQLPDACTVIDIQSQSSQIIRLAADGLVTKHLASEKCAAGSGRFMEVIANVLQVNLEDIGALSANAKNPISFTTGCAVFGESEAISRVAEGITKEDILAGVHEALARKILAMANRIGLEPPVAVCGGGAFDTGLVTAIKNSLGTEVTVIPQPQMVTALGAAILAQEESKLPPEERTRRTNHESFTRESLREDI
ncbi:acyl-CoA dehydratase activase [Chloroflexota bacterium]